MTLIFVALGSYFTSVHHYRDTSFEFVERILYPRDVASMHVRKNAFWLVCGYKNCHSVESTYDAKISLDILVIGLQAPILHKIDIDPPPQFFELLSTNGWLVDIFSFFQFFEKHNFFKIVTIHLLFIRFRYGLLIHRVNVYIYLDDRHWKIPDAVIR